MIGFKEIAFRDIENIGLRDGLAHSMIEVERVYIRTADANDIMPFVRYAHDVKMLHIKYMPEIYCGKGLDILTLNKVRAIGLNNKKLTICVNEEIFLATKRASLPTKCSFIELSHDNGFLYSKLYR